jgi:molybdopterin/thiamine biosynthesis adenylyltransferase
MHTRNLHESLHRGEAVLAALATTKIVVCGAGAVGSHVVEHLARLGARSVTVIDDDRVEDHNLPTQTYGENEVGLYKVEALRNRLFRAVGCEVVALRKRLDAANARKLLGGHDLIVDGFDNRASRQAVQAAVRALVVPCLHVGLAADYAEVVWDERYRVPDDAGGDVCDYPLARSTVLLATTVAAECVLRWLADKRRPTQDWSVTLSDFAIRPVAD